MAERLMTWLDAYYQPILSPRNPTVKDKADLGSLWANTTAGTGFFLARNANGLHTWIGLGGGGVAGALMTINPGDITATQGNIIASLGNIVATAGNILAGGQISSTGAVTAGTDLIAGVDVIATAGNVEILDGAHGVSFASGAVILSGTGDPNGIVTADQGSLFIRTDGVGANQVLYVNTTGAAVWVAK